MDPAELLRQLDRPPTPEESDAPPVVKQEVAEEENGAEQNEETPSGLAAMSTEMQGAVDKDKEATQRMTDFMMREEREPPAKKKKGGKDDEKNKEDRTPLTTFGFSSRPRRSVNYASIERGDEAQAQSLVTEFTGKKRAKRTRDELDGNYEEGEDNRRRKSRAAQRNQFGGSNSTMANGRAQVDYIKPATEEYSAIIPKPDDERPSLASRSLGAILERLPAVLRASGGFRRYVMWFDDAAAFKLIETVQRRCNLSDDNTANQKVLRALRHAYNSMPKAYRLGWERAAKMDIFDSRLFVPDIAMPLSEIPVKDVTRGDLIRGKGVRSNCCPSKPLISTMLQAMEHFLMCHDAVHFFGCDICRKIFPSRYELTRHECKEFNEIIAQSAITGQPLLLEVAYMYLCCSQCGLWLPLKATSDETKGWTYFASSLECHSCKPLVPIIVYFREPLPENEKNVRMNLSIIPHLDVTLELSCKECGIEEFESYAAIEDHFLTKHGGHDCNKCKIKCGTQFSLKHHQQTHMSSSAQFSNYLLYSATYEPPANSGRVRHIGAGSEIPVCGGCDQAELQQLEMANNKENGLVDPLENTYRRKMYMYRDKKSKKKENRANGSRREAGDSSGDEENSHERNDHDYSSSRDTDNDDCTSNIRRKKEKPLVKKYDPDLGYEHVNKEKMFEKTESEKECRKIMDRLFNMKSLMGHQRLLMPDEALEVLKEATAVELPAFNCPLAEEIAAALTRPLSLPVANCIDPLKDFVLLNKIFVYCKHCDTVVSRDIATHSMECQGSEDDMMEVFNAASGPQAGVRCIFPDCRIHLCSVVALRFHLNNVHNREIKIGAVVETTRAAEEFTASRYDKSLMNIAKRYQQTQREEKKSWLAKMTDVDCYLPCGGILEPKLQPRNPQIRQVVAAPPHRRVPMSGPSFAAEQTMRPLAQRNPNQQFPPYGLPPPPPPPQYHNLPHKAIIKPFRVPRVNRWYSCSWCDREYETLDPFVDHLVKVHSHTCTSCGLCFATLNHKRAHECTFKYDPNRRRPDSSLSGHCPACLECFSVETIYVHMLRRHFSTIEYNTEFGEMIPVPRNVEFRANAQMVPATRQAPPGFVHTPVDITYDQASNHEARQKAIKLGGSMVYGVDKKLIQYRVPPTGSVTICPPNPENIDTRLMCYMCELTFGDLKELTVHLEEHAEKWRHCPFCSDAVDGHFEMQKHLLTKHVINISNRLCCQYCHEEHRFMASHLLYRCRKISRCSICGQKSSDSLNNRGHMQRTHSLALRRFGCPYCPRTYASISEYYEHDCPAGGGCVFSCDCSPTKYFPTPSGFCDHFDSVHFHKTKCNICNYESKTQEMMIQHRNTHMRTELGNETTRKLYILIRQFFPKLDSSYMKFVNGGEKPSSYNDVNKTSVLYMMGNLGPVPLAAITTYKEPPRTLFDALNGIQRSPPRKSPPQGRVFTVQSSFQSQPSSSTAAVQEVVLSDDEDCVVIVGNSNNNNAPAEPSNVDRQVRVEEAQEGYNQRRNEPGYVAEDDDLEVAAANGANSGQPIVKEVVDENGDDELAVIAEVENSAGTLPSNVASGRERTFRCSRCSLKFFTRSSLKHHEETSHKQDAGDTICKETYGLPIDTHVAYICRNCSIAFESKEMFTKHTICHGATSYSCLMCSSIGFNQTSLQAHLQAHNEGRVSFACGTCMFQFPNDLALMDHLSIVHQISLFYFCKICGFGSTNAERVFQHLTFHKDSSWNIIQRFGACPAQLLNYNPTDEKDFVLKTQQKVIEVHKPSDCSHRNMLVCNDTAVSCTTCHCLQTLFNYCANNGYGRDDDKPMPEFKMMTPRDDKFPLWRHLDDKTAERLNRTGNLTTQPPPPQNPVALAEHNRRQVLFRQSIEARNQAANHVTVQRGGRAPVVSMTSNGTRPTYPVQQAPQFAQQQQQRMQNMPALLAQQQQRRVMPNAMRIANAPHLQPAQPVVRNATPVTTTCTYQNCQRSLANEFDRHLHAMHTKEASWFCRQCGHVTATEKQLFVHYIQRHLTPCYEKHVHEGFKSNVFRIKCPIPTCLDNFQSTLDFSRHMRKRHTTELPFEVECCETRFATKEHCDRHQRQHSEFLVNNGTDGPCCALCGTQDIWSGEKDQKIDCLLSHTLRHGLDYRSSCKVCLKQFAADTNQLLAVEHARAQHAAKAPNGSIHCKVCGKGGFSEYAFAEHFKKVHLFNILCKAAASVKGELVVTAGEGYERYVGLIHENRKLFPEHRMQATNQPSTSNATATVEVRESVGGNAALLNIAEAIGEPVRRSNVMDGEIMTID
ncbi:hypothetical protein CAEBREN_25309 [Caenorhabditis brenneri]|uniref:C2H2-type domain-containing protein n=1 Tax=Caenorhabditis brenneri TaxID=135651 RepID=G0MGL9_CAEBE|nr:hypothetical protein CAEBREN_25309 [Caenorhabditis brenneri]